MAKKLYVGGLPYSTTEDELREAFAKAGAVASVTILMDKMTGRSRGFGFVEMENDEDAAKGDRDVERPGLRRPQVDGQRSEADGAPCSPLERQWWRRWWWKPPQLVSRRSAKQKSPCKSSGVFVVTLIIS